jgi:predicted SprT family Zn-dependent metalloprotease
MASVYDDVEIEDMEFDSAKQTFYYPCPCGDKFFITLRELADGEDIATCPSCSLTIRVVYEEEDLEDFVEESSAAPEPIPVM